MYFSLSSVQHIFYTFILVVFPIGFQTPCILFLLLYFIRVISPMMCSDWHVYISQHSPIQHRLVCVCRFPTSITFPSSLLLLPLMFQCLSFFFFFFCPLPSSSQYRLKRKEHHSLKIRIGSFDLKTVAKWQRTRKFVPKIIFNFYFQSKTMSIWCFRATIAWRNETGRGFLLLLMFVCLLQWSVHPGQTIHFSFHLSFSCSLFESCTVIDDADRTE